ncbi:MAG: rod-binding protein [Deltaproteobacteria bacterium]|nr:rod-binding protein [Deltaproteobacteria bacterium]
MNAVARISPTDALELQKLTGAGSEAGRAQKLAEGLSAASRDEEIWKAAEGFEQIFLHSMMKQMRDTTFTSEDSLDGSNASRVYRGLFDEEIARAGAARHQLGLAKMIHDSLVRDLAIKTKSEPQHSSKY